LNPVAVAPKAPPFVSCPGGAPLGGLDLQVQEGDQHLDVLHLRFLSLLRPLVKVLEGPSIKDFGKNIKHSVCSIYRRCNTSMQRAFYEIFRYESMRTVGCEPNVSFYGIFVAFGVGRGTRNLLKTELTQ
jgi:hypothetical protein